LNVGKLLRGLLKDFYLAARGYQTFDALFFTGTAVETQQVFKKKISAPILRDSRIVPPTSRRQNHL
jgi:hypothetical protein